MRCVCNFDVKKKRLKINGTAGRAKKFDQQLEK